MTKIADKFIKKIKKLDNYFILKEENNYLMIGSQIKIKEPKTYTSSIFQSYNGYIEKTLYITFILTIDENDEIIKEYITKKIPILLLSSNLQTFDIESLQNYLDEYTKYKI